MTDLIQRLDADGPVLVFGGQYGNMQATEAVLAEARHLAVPRQRIICTGDIVAYCGDTLATIELVRDSGIHVIMGNCDEQLAIGASDCGCGYPVDSLCDRLSSGWYAHANAVLRNDHRKWLASFPRRIDLNIAGRRLAVIHGSISQINRFVFATTSVAVKRGELAAARCDGIIGGHCGLPFTEIIDGKLWHNAGVVGTPANDGTARVWYSVLTPTNGGLEIEHRALSYSHTQAARVMLDAGLPDEHGNALSTGLWPSVDVLPSHERRQTGAPLVPGRVAWPTFAWNTRSGKIGGLAPNRLLWPKWPIQGELGNSTAARNFSFS